MDHELIAYHGWGFDRGCWNDWQPVIPDSIAFHAFDRGYYGSSNHPAFEEESNLKILFLHSFGMHLCPVDQLSNSDMIVIFSGFLNFHPRALQLKKKTRMVLRQMINKFKKEPEEVLEDFFKNMEYTLDQIPEPSENFKQQQMLNDLKVLDEVQMNPGVLNRAELICILHGSRDRVVPKSKGRELYTLLQDKAHYFEVKDAGHALPFTHIDQCWSFIEPELEELL